MFSTGIISLHQGKFRLLLSSVPPSRLVQQIVMYPGLAIALSRSVTALWLHATIHKGTQHPQTHYSVVYIQSADSVYTIEQSMFALKGPDSLWRIRVRLVKKPCSVSMVLHWLCSLVGGV